MQLKESEKKILKRMFDNPDVILPMYSFPGLYLERDEFLTLSELIDISEQETLEKLLALREIGNSILAKNRDINGITYDEYQKPTIKFMLKDQAKLEYNIPSKDGISYYTLTEDILDYLLSSKNLASRFDLMLIQDYLDELELIQQTFKSGTFYPDFKVKDYTGILDISSTHNKYTLEQITDSIVIPEGFGSIKVNWSYGGFLDYDNFNLVYSPENKGINLNTSLNLKNGLDIDRIFVHKKLLPDAYNKKL